jgi:hypothetical protein
MGPSGLASLSPSYLQPRHLIVHRNPLPSCRTEIVVSESWCEALGIHLRAITRKKTAAQLIPMNPTTRKIRARKGMPGIHGGLVTSHFLLQEMHVRSLVAHQKLPTGIMQLKHMKYSNISKCPLLKYHLYPQARCWEMFYHVRPPS